MSLSITRSKLIHTIPDDDDFLNGEDGTDITPSFEMVAVKKEKDDIEIPPDPQVVDDEDDEINLKLMRKRVTQKNKRTETMKQGEKGSPARKN
ncbi:hypothetical protein FRX31_034079 [Thalictrum thalictroides]|uniref:Uncharacterized protein n=1 Tax=Thalictrum thalictroides TaxID=46969 RepID=A0A7J6UUQ8_THATH|nr:hypothetical protein FRX31_034079 [Thalictrum thalictroides]